MDERVTRAIRHLKRRPAFVVVTGFALAIVGGTAVLTLPLSGAGRVRVPLPEAFFTATSAVCVTGLAVVDTSTAWSTFGKLVLMVLVQIGGLGIMTVASLIAISLHRRLTIRSRRLTLVEAGALDPGDLRDVLRGVLTFSVGVEAVLAVVLALRFWSTYDLDPATAVGHGLFHSVMAFNNAGFALYSDGLVRFATDWVVCVPIMVAVVIGGLGFPVLIELTNRRSSRRRAQIGPPSRRLTLHTRLTLLVTAGLLVTGFVLTAAFEWTNPDTMGPLPGPAKLLAAAFHSVSTRTAGFNTVDIGAMRETTWLFSEVLMFVGSGSASTGGGIKVTTLAVLLLVCVSEARGERDVTFSGRTIPSLVQRQALAVTLLSIAVAGAVTTVLLAANPIRLDEALFEVVSAFGTVGLSAGITPTVDSVSRLALIFMMFFGRLGPLTLGYAFIARSRDRLFEYPEERPLVG
jgi:potassium uptake TrkH family protein